MLLAEEVTDRAAVVAVLHDTRRTAMNAELVLDAHAREVVALAERAVVVDEELRDDEEADALRAGRRTRGRASTRCTMLSATSCSPQVMKIF